MLIEKYLNLDIANMDMDSFISNFAKARVLEDREVENHARAISMALNSEEN